jgi:hypothetical protein
MYTVGAIILATILAWYAGRKNEDDRSKYDSAPSDLREWILLLHTRRELKLVCFLLGGLLVMPCVSADRMR